MPPPESDIVEILENNLTSLRSLSQKTICIIGGSGFIGTWLSNTILEANRQLDLGIKLFITGRKISKLNMRIYPRNLNNFEFIQTDFNKSESVLPESDLYFHAATPSSVATAENYDEIVTKVSTYSTDAILKSVNPNRDTTIIHLSSGAVYGAQDLELSHMPEIQVEISGKFLTPYAHSKLIIENKLDSVATNSHGKLTVSNPRLFAFIGPLLPIDSHFAAGNFMNNLLSGEPILLKGSPETKRSYLYPTDLISALLMIAEKPRSGAINIGSDRVITLENLGKMFIELSPSLKMIFLNELAIPSNYVPEISVLKKHFGWSQEVRLEDAIQRWKNWFSY